jgi:hypothetical protein
MWIDRLASQSGPTSSSQPSSRPYSPLPGRTSGGISPYVTSQRSGQTPRGSATSLVSSDSTTSLLGTASRKPSGSALRYSVSYNESPPGEGILGKLLGADPKTFDTHGHTLHSITESDLDLGSDLGSLSLEDFVASDPVASTPQSCRRQQATQEC